MLQEQRQHLAGQKAVEETAEEAGQGAEAETAEEGGQGAAVLWVDVVRMVLVQRDRG